MKIKLSQQLSQQTTMTAFMQQSIGVLMLTHQELTLTIEKELEENPLLEAVTTNPDIDKSLSFISRVNPINQISNNEDPQRELETIKAETLTDYLLHQLKLEIADPKLLEIGEHIIANINENGYLLCDDNDIIRHLKIKDHHDYYRVLSLIHTFEPEGIGSRNLKECLLIQLRSTEASCRQIAEIIIEEYFDALASKKYVEIIKGINVTLQEVEAAVALITSLDPYPGRNYNANTPNIYINPDVVIYKDDHG